MSRVFVTKSFNKFATKHRISDAQLLESIENAGKGLIDANLKGCLVKLRIGRKGQGKSSGFRTIVAFSTRKKSFFLYGFGKNVTANISRADIDGLEEYGSILLRLTNMELEMMTLAREILEI